MTTNSEGAFTKLLWVPLVTILLVVATACTPQTDDDADSQVSAPPAETEEDGAGANDTPQALTGGTYTLNAGGAGTVVLTVGDGMVEVESVEAAEGWSEGESEEGDDRATVQLTRDDSDEVLIDATVDDRDLEVDVGWVMAVPDGSMTLPAGDAGMVTFAVDGGAVRVESAEPAAGFVVVREDEDDDGDGEVHFVNEETKTRVEFDAWVEGTRLSVALDTVVGASFGEEDDAEDEREGDDSAEDNDGGSGGSDGDDEED